MRGLGEVQITGGGDYAYTGDPSSDSANLPAVQGAYRLPATIMGLPTKQVIVGLMLLGLVLYLRKK